MFKKFLLTVLALVVAGIAAFLIFAPGIVERERNAVTEHAPYPISQAAQTLHARMIIGDLHADSLLWKRNILDHGSRGQVDVPRLITGNVAIQIFTAVTKSPAGQNYDENSAEALDNITLLAIGQLWPVRTWTSLLQRALYQAEKLHTAAANSDGQLRVITTRAELETLLADRAAGAQVVGGILGIEGAHPLEGDLSNLDLLTDAGYRLIALQHFFDNALGGSLHGEGNHGLTEFGRAAVAEIATRPLILDLAHSSPQVARDVLELTDIPLVVSHTGIHSVCPRKRNFTDDLMQDIAATGGVIGIGYWAGAICDDSPTGIAATIVAAIGVVGEDHVALGSDFDGSVTTTLDVSELPAVTQALLDAGLNDQQIAKVMGANMLRVLRDRLP